MLSKELYFSLWRKSENEIGSKLEKIVSFFHI